MKHVVKIYLYWAILFTMFACQTKIPTDFKLAMRPSAITPDYSDLSIPVNIAPLNFVIDEKGEEYMARLYNRQGDQLIAKGHLIDWDVKKWHKLLQKTKDDTIYVDVFVKNQGIWTKYVPFHYFVAEEIDSYISYRQIEPLYVNFETLRICQRNLTNFEEKEIYNNSPFLSPEGGKQCINCHSYQDYNRTHSMQMHIRVNHAGTLILRNGEITKVNLKVGDAYSAGAYTSWHPSEPLIAYSINDTWQHFHSVDNNKVEVQDAASDLILYDVDNNIVEMLTDTKTMLETFPYWSPDGQYLYYIGAQVPEMTSEEMSEYRYSNYKDIKYDIYKMRFDLNTRTFSEPDTVFMASIIGKSATFPRESPDGKYMIFTMGEYGTFHNFHHDADLYLKDLTTDSIRRMDEINSDDTESYHSWSSNGRWIVFSSRRGSGSYTRLYLTHFDENGKGSKPFILPQKTPAIDQILFKSYNVPEFMAKPVEISRAQMIEAVKTEPISAIFKNKE